MFTSAGKNTTCTSQGTLEPELVVELARRNRIDLPTFDASFAYEA
ncbi:hypothetical protein [Nonomuraea sp. KM90]